ncbi:MAG: hypothetical protein C4334_10500 [Pyrinomonas sp.]|uniref:S8 family peptidase n=1 Tax=Pyrinomonas sp. TaxID=2080306 RepID=UPI0033343FC0
MNRKTFPIHLTLATVLILLAAIAGQIRREWQERENRLARQMPTQKMGELMRKRAEVLVRFRPDVAPQEIARISSLLHDNIEDRIESVPGLVVIADEDGLDAEQVADQYRSLSNVEYAEPNYVINLEPDPQSATATKFTIDYSLRQADDPDEPDDALFPEQWSLKNSGQRGGKIGADISALRAWSKTTGSQEVVVAVLDSGVDYLHPDLLKNIWVRPQNIAAYNDPELGQIDDKFGYNAIKNDGDPMDDNGHGTHVAGIIGAEGNNQIGIAGINWNVRIMPLKFLSSGGFGTTKDAIECINYAIDRKRAGVPVRIINASWGSTRRSRALEDAIRRAGEEGILFVAAAGNTGSNTDIVPHYPASYRLPNVISVAALDRQDRLASFSNYGPKSVHIAAPGAEMLSTWPGGAYEEHSGTSMATPVVAGVAALVLSLEPDLSVNELRTRLLDAVDPLNTLSGKIVTGGKINAARAVGAQ